MVANIHKNIKSPSFKKGTIKSKFTLSLWIQLANTNAAVANNILEKNNVKIITCSQEGRNEICSL